MEEAKIKSVFETLNGVDVTPYIDKKDDGKSKLDYLSWATAVRETKKIYPDMSYNIMFFDGKPFLYDENLGYMVFTNVTINKQTIDMWLPVMDGSNKAMKKEPYTIETKWGKKTIAAATMFDINKTLMRCLAKNLAMFGLGISLYAGEDLVESDEIVETKKVVKKAEPKKEIESEPVNVIPEIKCESCGKNIEDYTDEKNKYFSAKVLAEGTIKKYGKSLCMNCVKIELLNKAKEEQMKKIEEEKFNNDLKEKAVDTENKETIYI